jgi:rhodanese-related sulfurtransferase
VAGAVNVPLQELEGRMAELEKYRSAPVYVICQSGGRSARGAAALRTAGYQAVNVQGGTSAWVSAGYPVEQ